MKSASLSLLASALALAMAGCTTEKYGKFTPKAEAQPAKVEFSDYGNAMAHHDGYQMAY